MRQLLVSIIITMAYLPQTVKAVSSLPPCDQRPHFIDPPWVSAQYFCAEEIIHDESAGEMGFTSLITSPDGTLYATRPLSGQVFQLYDMDGDDLPESIRIIAESLTRPNGLAFFEEVLYISGANHIYTHVDGITSILVDDLPTGEGFWTGGITIGNDRRLYVGIGAACDYCVGDNQERGTILSFNLDGTDRRQEAIGLRQPSDVAFLNGHLWTVDTAREGLPTLSNYDELNLVIPGSNFGWPYCIGQDRQPDTIAFDYDCQATTAPAYSFETHSNPFGITAYEGEAFPHLRGNLLITLGGSYNQAELRGFTLISFNPTEEAAQPHIILPEVPNAGPQWSGINLQKIHYQASGFWPHRPYDVTISPEGWIYVSSGGGRIWALRPR